MELKDYIDRHYGGSRAAFARDVDVPKQRVNEWLAAGYIVYNGEIYSKRRSLPAPPKGER